MNGLAIIGEVLKVIGVFLVIISIIGFLGSITGFLHSIEELLREINDKLDNEGIGVLKITIFIALSVVILLALRIFI